MDRAPTVGSSSNSTSRRPRKGQRETVRAACNFCCTRKIKCDAVRPQCSACVNRGRLCVYDTKDGFETRGEATKRRCDDLERQKVALTLTRCDNCQLLAARQAEEAAQQSSTASAMDGRSMFSSPGATNTPTLYDEAVMPHASEILSALLNSTDEISTGILAALRNGMPWQEVGLVDSSTALLDRRLWLDTPASDLNSVHENAESRHPQRHDETADLRLPHQHETANLRLPQRRLHGQIAFTNPFSFDRLIWLQELVRYRASPETRTIECIQIVADSMYAANATSYIFSSAEAAASGSANSGLRCTYQVPLCAVASMVNIGDLRCPFVKMYLDLSAQINTGISAQTIFGSHVHISALNDEESYTKAPRLSQSLASMVNSIKLDGDEGHVPRTKSALMWLYWLLWRWLLDTSAASFHALPRMIRPTPWQSTVAHPLVFDFVISSGLRDHLCQQGVLNCKWITAACASLSCDDTPEDFYCIDPFTGELDISVAAKAHISQPGSWSYGPDMRQCFHNIDMYMRIRSPTTAG